MYSCLLNRTNRCYISIGIGYAHFRFHSERERKRNEITNGENVVGVVREEFGELGGNQSFENGSGFRFPA